jgi:hypothetical protein
MKNSPTPPMPAIAAPAATFLRNLRLSITISFHPLYFDRSFSQKTRNVLAGKIDIFSAGCQGQKSAPDMLLLMKRTLTPYS